MISDILSRMVTDLDYYLNDANFHGTYGGETRERLVRLRNEADDLRLVLDTLPDAIPAAGDGPDQTASKMSKFIDWMMSDESAVIPPIFSQKDLLGRGWSKRLIAQLLGEPDWTSDNPHGAGFAPMRCWREDRAKLAEDSREFREHRSRKSRSGGAPR
jgi:hypothetical protein